ncbi:MAG: hypothetical protein M3Q29_10540 [Chloroflexota bacterium]|nr:hypothetical protein [Chloroflexota bacterium]
MHYPIPTPITVAAPDVAALSMRYVAMLEEAGIPDPLTQPITVAAMLVDLCELVGQPVPAAVALALEATR